MNTQEVAQVVTKIQLGDNRQIDRVALAYWVEAIGELDFADALEAVTMHRREKPEVWLEPGHLFANCRRIREARERRERMARPALERPAITLNREKFEAEYEAELARVRRERMES